MIELPLTNGNILSYDGRVLELFGGQPVRMHVRQLSKVKIKDGKKPRLEIHWGNAGVVFASFDPGHREYIDQLLGALNAARPGEIEFS